MGQKFINIAYFLGSIINIIEKDIILILLRLMSQIKMKLKLKLKTRLGKFTGADLEVRYNNTEESVLFFHKKGNNIHSKLHR